MCAKFWSLTAFVVKRKEMNYVHVQQVSYNLNHSLCEGVWKA